MLNQSEIGPQSQLPTRNEIVNLAEEELANVTGCGLIRSTGSGIAKGAEFIAGGAKSAGRGIAEGAKSVGYGVEKGAKATWKFIY